VSKYARQNQFFKVDVREKLNYVKQEFSMNRFFLTSALLCLCNAFVLHGAMRTSSEEHHPAFDLSHHIIEAGANYTWARISPDGNPSSSGSLGGLQASYQYRAPDAFYGGATFAWRQGSTSGSGIKRELLDFDLQERLGYTFAYSQNPYLFTLFSGFGYRYLGQEAKTNGNSVDFDYNEFYIPVGILFDGRITPSFVMGVNLIWMPQVYPTVTISPIGGARWKVTYQVDNFSLEIPLTFSISQRYNCFVRLVPFVEVWHDGHTTATTTTGSSLNVPGNSYIFTGLNLNIGYSF